MRALNVESLGGVSRGRAGLGLTDARERKEGVCLAKGGSSGATSCCRQEGVDIGLDEDREGAS